MGLTVRAAAAFTELCFLMEAARIHAILASSTNAKPRSGGGKSAASSSSTTPACCQVPHVNPFLDIFDHR